MDNAATQAQRSTLTSVQRHGLSMLALQDRQLFDSISCGWKTEVHTKKFRNRVRTDFIWGALVRSPLLPLGVAMNR